MKHIVRSTGSGVWFGEIVSRDATPAGLIVSMRDARRLWRWRGATELSDVATRAQLDPSWTRLGTPVSVDVVGAHEILEVTEAAAARMEALPPWLA